MNYFLEINGKVFNNVSDIKIEERYRNETVTYMLGGSISVERIGTPKTALRVQINGINDEEMLHLKQAVQLATETTCSYYQGSELKVKKMRVSPFIEPKPLYFYNDREKGFIYSRLNLELEEV